LSQPVVPLYPLETTQVCQPRFCLWFADGTKGDRSDVVLQVLDDVKRQLTYPDWKTDVRSAQETWVYGSGLASVRSDIEKMRRRQQLCTT